jgi:hypothetical protein
MWSKRVVNWLILWSICLLFIFLSARYSDRVFSSFMESGKTDSNALFKLLPQNVTFFVEDSHFHEDWSKLRNSEMYAALSTISNLREFLENWKLNGQEISSFEKWLLQIFRTSLDLAYSEKDQTLYLFTPLQNHENSVEWLQKVSRSVFTERVDWSPRFLGKHFYLDAAASPFWPIGIHVQSTVIGSVGIIAMSPKNEPLSDIFVTVDEHRSLWDIPDFKSFVLMERERNQSPFGFSSLGENKLGLTWELQKYNDTQWDIRARFPNLNINSSSTHPSQLLAALRRPEDYISSIFSLQDASVIWSELERVIPQQWTKPIHEVQVDLLMGSFKSIWDPVIEKMEKQIYVGFGEAELLSDKYKIPFPHVILGIPFQEPKVFLKALETTVYKANEKFDANLFVRKNVRPSGEYYEIKMGNSKWKQQHGLKELPVFAITNGLLIVSTSEGLLEKTLENLSSKLNSENQPSIEGLDIVLNTQESPKVIRILLGALGVFSSEGENIFLSPTTMHTLNDLFGVMSQFDNAHLVCTFNSGVIEVKASLKPKMAPPDSR